MVGDLITHGGVYREDDHDVKIGEQRMNNYDDPNRLTVSYLSAIHFPTCMVNGHFFLVAKCQFLMKRSKGSRG